MAEPHTGIPPLAKTGHSGHCISNLFGFPFDLVTIDSSKWVGLDSDTGELRLLAPVNATFSQASFDILLSGIARPAGYPEHGDRGE